MADDVEAHGQDADNRAAFVARLRAAARGSEAT
jgi:hypothetical protein